MARGEVARGAAGRRAALVAEQSSRRLVVAERLLAGDSLREILVWLRSEAGGQREVSLATVGRDVQAVLAEWAQARQGKVEAYAGRQLARIEQLYRLLTPRLVDGEGRPDLDVVREIRHLLELEARISSVVKPSAGLLPGLPAGTSGRISVEVEYTADWRQARAVLVGGE